MFNQIIAAHCCLCNERTLTQSIICEPCWQDMMINRPTCERCGHHTTHKGVCSHCLRRPGAIDNTVSLLAYQFPATSLLLSLKYKDQTGLAHEFGRRLADKIQRVGAALPSCIIPVPLHPLRLISRGYNQALEISRVIGARLAIPVNYRLTRRARHTLPQFNLRPEQRKRNLQNAFRINNTVLTGTVAIVDDIVTTGHTTNQLAKQLKRAGATEVYLWVCAHAR